MSIQQPPVYGNPAPFPMPQQQPPYGDPGQGAGFPAGAPPMGPQNFSQMAPPPDMFSMQQNPAAAPPQAGGSQLASNPVFQHPSGGFAQKNFGLDDDNTGFFGKLYTLKGMAIATYAILVALYGAGMLRGNIRNPFKFKEIWNALLNGVEKKAGKTFAELGETLRTKAKNLSDDCSPEKFFPKVKNSKTTDELSTYKEELEKGFKEFDELNSDHKTTFENFKTSVIKYIDAHHTALTNKKPIENDALTTLEKSVEDAHKPFETLVKPATPTETASAANEVATAKAETPDQAASGISADSKASESGTEPEKIVTPRAAKAEVPAKEATNSSGASN